MSLDQDPVVPTKLPQQTIDRWRLIVTKAAKSGTDISQLVQHFAEQSFQNKVSLLEHQGVHRRALTNMRAVVVREREKAEAVLPAGAHAKTGALFRPYEAVRFDFVAPPASAAASKPGRKVTIKDVPLGLFGDEHGCKTVPQKPNLTTSEQLRAYIKAFEGQIAHIDGEIQKIDAVLNQGMRNHQAVVTELAATSRELYRLAQETLAELPQAEPLQPPSAIANDTTLTYVEEVSNVLAEATAAPAAATASPEPGSPQPSAATTFDAKAKMVGDALQQWWSRIKSRGNS